MQPVKRIDFCGPEFGYQINYCKHITSAINTGTLEREGNVDCKEAFAETFSFTLDIDSSSYVISIVAVNNESDGTKYVSSENNVIKISSAKSGTVANVLHNIESYFQN